MVFTKLKTLCRSIFITALVVTVLTLIASFFLALFLGAALFFFTPEGLNFGLLYFRYIPIYLFTILSFNAPVVISVGGFFRLLWVVFAVCLVAAWRHRESLHHVIAKSFSQPLRKLLDNCLFATPLIASTTLVAVIAITMLQKGVGIPTGELPFSSNPFETLLWLAYAAVAEEIGFRIIPIGAFLIIYLLWVGSRNPGTLSVGTRLKLLVMAPLVPEEAKKLVGANSVGALGIKRGVSVGEWIMILSTATVFGLTHYLSGGGWEIGKISSSAVAGFVMGLTYLLYGAQAPILLHWFFNYYLWFFFPGEDGGLPLVARLNPGFRLTFELLDLTIFVLGVLGLLTLSVLGLRELHRHYKRRKTETGETEPGVPLSLGSEKFRPKRV